MLQLSGLAATPDEFMDCMGRYPNDLEFCRAMYPQTANDGLTPTAVNNPVEQQINRICDTCGTDKWCDGTQCIPFTAAEQAEYQASGALPALAVAIPKPASWIPGISNKTLVIGAGLVAVLLLLRR